MIRQLPTRRSAFKPHPLGPRDEGRKLTEQQYLRCSDAPGYVSEIFDGAVHVSPSPVPIHGYWQRAIFSLLDRFSAEHPELFNHVDRDNDVVIDQRPGPARPRPDITTYRNFPSIEELPRFNDWSFFCPVLVVEIVSKRRRRKDIERNRSLYWASGGIVEYWIIDPTQSPSRPTLTVLVRQQGLRDWTEHRIAFGRTYQSDAFAGLSLNLKSLTQGSKKQ